MKAYKASYNGKCLDLTYEVGKTYETDKIEMCKRGFHACKKMVSTLYYYGYCKEFVLFEVEILGKIIHECDKLITDKIKIVRVVPPEEYEDFKVDDKGNLLYRKINGKVECWYEYDERNNCIHHKNSNGYEWWKEYDKNNSLTLYNVKTTTSL